jgi:hypothetical protein
MPPIIGGYAIRFREHHEKVKKRDRGAGICQLFHAISRLYILVLTTEMRL